MPNIKQLSEELREKSLELARLRADNARLNNLRAAAEQDIQAYKDAHKRDQERVAELKQRLTLATDSANHMARDMRLIAAITDTKYNAGGLLEIAPGVRIPTAYR